MDINLDEHLNTTLDTNFLGKKRFDVILSSKTPEYSINLQGSQNYNFPSKNKSEKPSGSLQSLVASQSFNVNKVNVTNSFKPHEEDILENKLTYDTGNYGQVTLTQKSSKLLPFSAVSLRHSFVKHGFDSKVDLGYSNKDALTFASFMNYTSKTNIFNSWFPLGFEHNFGSLLKASVLDLKVKDFSFFFYLKYSKYRFLFAHSSDLPTFENFFDVFTLGVEKKSDTNSSILLKMRHDYRKKETEIDLLKEMKINDNATLTNKVTSNYYIGTSLTYSFSPKIKISHCSEIDLKKFFKEEENYKYGVRIDITL